ncbi:MAG: hypothetical protein AB8B53_09415, partial [Flavobacteriales bacterium]
MSNPITYTFLPWIRKGISSVLTASEGNLPSGDVGPRVKLQATVNFQDELTSDARSATKTISLISPGDILGIDEREIFRIDPQPYSKNLESNYLPIVEFFSEDLPWRYSPVATHHEDDKKLTPWFYLLVLKDDNEPEQGIKEFHLPDAPSDGNFLSFSPNAINNIDQILPPADQVYAWAHVHINKAIENGQNLEDLKSEIEANPNLAFSRIISPRKLEPDQNYQCFIIPTFETGRKAGLGEDISTVPYYQYAWDLQNFTAANARFPYYYTWKFRTAEGGDFETLAGKITPRQAATLSTTQRFTLEDSGLQMPTGTDSVLEFEGALVAPGFTSAPFLEEPQNEEFVIDLGEYVNSGVQEGSEADNPDPTVVAPAFGKWITENDELDVTDPLALQRWYEQLNLDPRNRLVAGLGAEIVKENQEEFMRESWDQIAEINRANQQIREAKLIGKAGDRIVEKHIIPSTYNVDAQGTTLTTHEKKAASRLLTISRGKVLDSIGMAQNETKSALDALDESSVPNALFSGAFRKLARPGRKIMKQLSAVLPEGSLTDTLLIDHNVDGTLTPVGQIDDYEFLTPLGEPVGTYDTTTISTVMNNLSMNSGAYSDFVTNMQNAWVNYETALANEPAPAVSTAHAIDVPALKASINPLERIKEEIINQIEIWDPTAEEFVMQDSFDQIMAYPELDFPLYDYLEKIARHAIFPNLQEIEENSVTIMETNPKFIEALMMGANQEMARELMWRKYPTDQKGSYFRMFWDKSDSD